MEDTPLPSGSPNDLAELKARCDSLHSLLVSLLLLTIVVSGTFWIFLMRQVKTSKTDLGFVKVNYTNALAQFQRTQPIIDETVKRLQEFGNTNVDFQPILKKYNLTPGATSGPAASAAASAKKASAKK